MGYTHYWNRDEAEIQLNKWRKAVEFIRPIVESGDYGLEDIKLTDDVIFFNGQHETFVVQRCFEHAHPEMRSSGHFAFCKTAMKEYDPVVIACLLILDHQLKGDPVGFQWSSDGNWPEEHSAGIELSGLLFEKLRGPQ